MTIKSNKKERVRRSFYWKVPGDVPGYRTESDPYMADSKRADTGVPDRVVTQTVEAKRQPDEDVALARTVQSPKSTSKSTSKSTQSRNLFKGMAFFPVMLLILLVIGIPGQRYADGVASTRTDHISETAQPESVVTKPVKQIVDLKPDVVPGTPNQTAQTTLRVVVHKVVKGDTLWDIAEKYVQDPFRYPELAKSSQIENPHLIYPDDVVRIHIYEEAA